MGILPTWTTSPEMLVTHLVPTMTIWREASGEGAGGMLAVAWVIRNRMTKRCLSAASVCLQPWQFSSMTAKGDPGMERWPGPLDASFPDAFAAWTSALDAKVADPTLGADFYFADTIQPPSWAADYTFTVQIGHHRFYRS